MQSVPLGFAFRRGHFREVLFEYICQPFGSLFQSLVPFHACLKITSEAHPTGREAGLAPTNADSETASGHLDIPPFP
jgi:hypothetical protein